MADRNFRLLFAGRTVSYFGTYLAPIAVAFAILDLHGSATAGVGAYGWMSAMVFLPAGYALAGPIASAVGMRAYLLFGAAWLVASTLVVYRLPAVRDFAYEEPAEAAPAAAPA